MSDLRVTVLNTECQTNWSSCRQCFSISRLLIFKCSSNMSHIANEVSHMKENHVPLCVSTWNIKLSSQYFFLTTRLQTLEYRYKERKAASLSSIGQVLIHISLGMFWSGRWHSDRNHTYLQKKSLQRHVLFP